MYYKLNSIDSKNGKYTYYCLLTCKSYSRKKYIR